VWSPPLPKADVPTPAEPDMQSNHAGFAFCTPNGQTRRGAGWLQALEVIEHAGIHCEAGTGRPETYLCWASARNKEPITAHFRRVQPVSK
jgi:hypothetical protein